MTRVPKHVTAHSLVNLQRQTDTHTVCVCVSVCLCAVGGGMESDRRATGQMPFQRQLRAIGPGKQVAELATIAEITSCVSRIASNYINWTFPHL